MRLLIVSVLSVSVLATVLPMCAHAQAYDPYAWCAVYGGSMSGSSNCGFRTRQQCMATVSGIGGSCEPNQFYNAQQSWKRGRTARPPDQPAAPFYGPSGGWSRPSYYDD
jgi:Protein of unknown function (DUF3551)